MSLFGGRIWIPGYRRGDNSRHSSKCINYLLMVLGIERQLCCYDNLDDWNMFLNTFTPPQSWHITSWFDDEQFTFEVESTSCLDIHLILVLFPVESITDFIRGNVSTLVECLDTENGFAECLLSKGVLNADQCDVITNRNAFPSYRNQNKTLLLDMILPNLNTESMYESFLEALIETDQRHIYNFINHSGKSYSKICSIYICLVKIRQSIVQKHTKTNYEQLMWENIPPNASHYPPSHYLKLAPIPMGG